MDLGFERVGTVKAVAEKLRHFADALEAAGNKLPPEADIIALVDARVRLYRPLQKRKNPKQQKAAVVEEKS